MKKTLKGIFILLFGLFGQNLFAINTTFTFDGGDNALSTITKTVDGLTITLSNPSPNQTFRTDYDGVYIVKEGTITSFDISFSKDIKLISYTIDYIYQLDSSEEMNLTNNNQSSLDSNFTVGSHDFNNSLTVLANSIINVKNKNTSSSVQMISIVVSRVIIPEPTNHPTSLSVTVNNSSQITTSWIDSIGGQAPDGYLLMCSTSDSFIDPVDTIAQSDDSDCSDGSGVVNITNGVETYQWSGLRGDTQYYYKLYPYTNSGSDIDYKTDGTPLATTLVETLYSKILTNDNTFIKPTVVTTSGGGSQFLSSGIVAGTSSFNYSTIYIKPTLEGNYTFEVLSSDISDSLLMMYDTSFDKDNPLDNFLIGNDDSGNGFLPKLDTSLIPIALTAGKTYALVLLPYSSGDTGNSYLNAIGPGRVLIGHTVIITTNDLVLKSTDVATVTFTLSEVSNDFTESDIDVVGGTLSNFIGSGTTYTANFTPTIGSTSATIDVATGKFTNTAGNTNIASNQLTMSVDTIAPTVTITSNDLALKVGDVATLTFTLSEASTDFAIGDITAVGGTLSNFAGSGAIYKADFTPNTSSTTGATVDVVADKFTDTAGNTNIASTQLTMSVDTVAPTVTITTNDLALKVGDVANLTFTLSEASIDFILGDITAVGGTLSNFAGSGAIYTADFTPNTSSTTGATVDVALNNFTDTAGNTNIASTQLTMSVDTISPTVTITTNNSTLKVGDVATLTFTLSESSTDFAIGDITAVGGALSNFAGSGAIYTVNLTPIASSTTSNIVYITADKFTDTAGNTNIASNQLTMSVDIISPIISSLTPADNASGVSRDTNLTMTMSEDIIKGTGNIVIKKSSDGSIVETIAITSSMVTISGAVVTIDPTVILDFDSLYFVQIEDGAIKDKYNNSFVGITDTTSWSFTTEKNKAPVISNTVSGQIVDDNRLISPFSTVTLADNEDDNISITITIDDNGKGVLSQSTIANGTIASVQSTLRAITFSPTPNSVAVGSTETTTFNIIANDKTSNSIVNSDTTVVSTSINDLPTSENISFIIDEDKNKIFTTDEFVFIDIDVGDTLKSIIITTLPTVGVLTLNDVNVTLNQEIKDITNLKFTPKADENGTPYTTFEFKVNDGEANSTLAYVATINVNPIDDAPYFITKQGDYEVMENSGAKSVILQAIDKESDTFKYKVSTSNDKVSLSLVGDNLIITPLLNKTGDVTVNVTVTEDNNTMLIDSYSFRVTINPVNKVPVINTLFNDITIAEDNGISSYEIDISDIDLDDLNLTIESNNTNILTISPNWSGVLDSSNWINRFNLTTVPNANGVVQITIMVSDGDLNSSKTFDVIVTEVDDAPTINTLFNNITITENNGTSSYEINISDIDLDDLNLTIESNNTSILTVSPNWNGLLDSSNWINSFNITTVPNANGVVKITIMVSDGDLNSSKTFDVIVTEVDYAPILEAIIDINKNEDDNIFDIILNASDSDGDIISYQATSSHPSIATVTEHNGVLTITPLSNQNGIVTIEVVASANGKSDSKSFKVNISPTNDVPTIIMDSNITIDENQEQTLSFSAIDVDGDSVAVIIKKDPQYGEVTKSGSNITYTPYSDFSGSDNFILSFDDGNGGSVDKTIVVVVNPVNSDTNITVASMTKLLTTLKDTNITVDEESGETTIMADSNVTTEIGFVYRAIVTIDKIGKAKTKIIRVNLETLEETLIDLTLRNGFWYKEGNLVNISIANGMLQIEILTTIDEPIIIN